MQGFLSDLFGGGGSKAEAEQPPAEADDQGVPGDAHPHGEHDADSADQHDPLGTSGDDAAHDGLAG